MLCCWAVNFCLGLRPRLMNESQCLPLGRTWAMEYDWYVLSSVVVMVTVVIVIVMGLMVLWYMCFGDVVLQQNVVSKSYDERKGIRWCCRQIAKVLFNVCLDQNCSRHSVKFCFLESVDFLLSGLSLYLWLVPSHGLLLLAPSLMLLLFTCLCMHAHCLVCLFDQCKGFLDWCRTYSFPQRSPTFSVTAPAFLCLMSHVTLVSLLDQV